MGKTKRKVQLSTEERKALRSLVRKEKNMARKAKRAQILLKLQEGKSHSEVAKTVGVSRATVYNIHDRYLSGHLKALEEKPRPGQPRKVTEEVEAAVIRIARSQPPEGKPRWTVALINKKLRESGYRLNDESVRLILKKANVNLGWRRRGAMAKRRGSV